MICILTCLNIAAPIERQGTDLLSIINVRKVLCLRKGTGLSRVRKLLYENYLLSYNVTEYMLYAYIHHICGINLFNLPLYLVI